MTKSQKNLGYLMALKSICTAFISDLNYVLKTFTHVNVTSVTVNNTVKGIEDRLKYWKSMEKFYDEKLSDSIEESPQGEERLEVLASPHLFMLVPAGGITVVPGSYDESLFKDLLEKEDDLFSEEEIAEAFSDNSLSEYHEILNALVDDNFGVHISVVPGTDSDDLALIGFMPHDTIEQIPKDYISIFARDNAKFQLYVNDLLESTDTLEPIPQEHNDDAKKIIKKRLKLFRKEYKKIYGESLKTVYKRTLGLRDKYEGIVKDDEPTCACDTKQPYRCCDEELEIRGKGRNIDLT